MFATAMKQRAAQVQSGITPKITHMEEAELKGKNAVRIGASVVTSDFPPGWETMSQEEIEDFQNRMRRRYGAGGATTPSPSEGRKAEAVEDAAKVEEAPWPKVSPAKPVQVLASPLLQAPPNAASMSAAQLKRYYQNAAAAATSGGAQPRMEEQLQASAVQTPAVTPARQTKSQPRAAAAGNTEETKVEATRSHGRPNPVVEAPTPVSAMMPADLQQRSMNAIHKVMREALAVLEDDKRGIEERIRYMDAMAAAGKALK
ncbi:unnamed protein product, partial [Symbiodinium sp. KB8]